MSTTTASFTRRFARLARAAAVATALVTVGSIALEAAPAAAAAREGSFSATAVRCWNPHGQLDINLGVFGAYDNQWVAVRHYMYVWNASTNQWASNVGAWENRQVAGPNTFVLGGTDSLKGLAPGTYMALYTQVSYWDGEWGPVRNVGARHFQNQGNLAGGYCRI